MTPEGAASFMEIAALTIPILVLALVADPAARPELPADPRFKRDSAALTLYALVIAVSAETFALRAILNDRAQDDVGVVALHLGGLAAMLLLPHVTMAAGVMFGFDGVLVLRVLQDAALPIFGAIALALGTFLSGPWWLALPILPLLALALWIVYGNARLSVQAHKKWLESKEEPPPPP